MNNKEKDFAPSSWAINNSTTMYVVMALVLFLGINAYFNMPREEYPEIKENIVFVSSIYPGNTAEDVEKLITEPLEDKLKAVNNILEIKSSSKENFSLIIIEFDDGIGYTEAKLKVKDEVESAVASEDWPMYNNVKVDPNVFNMTFTEEMPIVNINISGDYSTEKLKEYSEILQDEIESLNEKFDHNLHQAMIEIENDSFKYLDVRKKVKISEQEFNRFFPLSNQLNSDFYKGILWGDTEALNEIDIQFKNSYVITTKLISIDGSNYLNEIVFLLNNEKQNYTLKFNRRNFEQ